MTTLYSRIKKRREELGMSQAELAEKLGYSDRSTIAKIEKGVNDITQSKIAAFAEHLHTTPAYLMGWTDDYYDYELDEDNRTEEIPLAIHAALMEQYNGDFEQVWHAWLRFEDAAEAPALSKPDVLDEVDIAFYGEYRELSEDDKGTIRDMVRVMRERRAKKQEK